MNAGRMDRRVRIERFTSTEDPLGGETEDWDTLATVWAQKLEQRAGEAWRAGQTAATLETVFLIRWSNRLADLSARDRLVYAGRTYSILGVTEEGRREGLRIVCIAQVDE